MASTVQCLGLSGSSSGPSVTLAWQRPPIQVRVSFCSFCRHEAPTLSSNFLIAIWSPQEVWTMLLFFLTDSYHRRKGRSSCQFSDEIFHHFYCLQQESNGLGMRRKIYLCVSQPWGVIWVWNPGWCITKIIAQTTFALKRLLLLWRSLL